MTVTNQNFIQEEIKRGLNSGNTCYHSVHNLLSSHLLSKNVKLRIHDTIILSKMDEVPGGWRKLHNKELCNLYSLPSIIRMMKLRKMRWAGHVAWMGSRTHICY
jgi:hypothetical protein